MQITVPTASINYPVSFEYCSFNWVLLVFDGWRSEKAMWNKLQQSILWYFQGCSLPLNLHSNWIPIRFYAPWVIRRRCTRSYQWASFMLLFGVFLPSFLPHVPPLFKSLVFGVWKVLYVVYQPRAARQPAVANQLKSKWVINNEGFFHPLIWLVVQSRGIRCAAVQHHPLPIAIFKWVDGGWQYLSSATREFLSPPQTIWSGNTPTVIS